MKFVASLLFLGVFLFGGYILFTRYQNSQSLLPQKGLDVTLTGTVTRTNASPEYSFILTNDTKVTPLSSTHVDISVFVNEKVTVTGQYSGTTLYVDSIKLPN